MSLKCINATKFHLSLGQALEAPLILADNDSTLS
jgi:hypothetical protein